VRPCCEYFIAMAIVVAAHRDRCWGWEMKILIFGRLRRAQYRRRPAGAVTLFDRAGLPPAARQAFARHADLLRAVHGEVTDRQAIADVVAGGYHAIVLGATITAGPVRDAADAESTLQVNVLAPIPILHAARRRGVARIVNLSSAAAYAAAGSRHTLRDEATACDPDSLYAITNDCLWRKADLRKVGYQPASVLVDGRTSIPAIGQCRNSERDGPAGLVVRGRSRSADQAAVRR
jgi:NAD(P)-dependent dehydrogenase (short-subunit alcohol dehydrogenase family)